jgi:hypothetical protein
VVQFGPNAGGMVRAASLSSFLPTQIGTLEKVKDPVSHPGGEFTTDSRRFGWTSRQTAVQRFVDLIITY